MRSDSISLRECYISQKILSHKDGLIINPVPIGTGFLYAYLAREWHCILRGFFIKYRLYMNRELSKTVMMFGEENMKAKNGFLEILRLVFCLMIFMHHSGFLAVEGAAYPFKAAGFYGVEFFFILTGALTMSHVKNKMTHLSESGELKEFPMKYSARYTVSKLKKVFPYAFFGIILSYILAFISSEPQTGLKDRLFGGWNIIFEALFLPMTGIMNIDLNTFLNAPLWYLSVILMVLPLVMYLAVRYKDVFNNYLTWIVPLMLHGLLINKYGNIGLWGEFSFFTYVGVLRGLADILLGCFMMNLAVLIYEKAHLLDEGKRKVLTGILTVAEILLYLFAIHTFSSNVDGYTYEAACLLLALAVSISLSRMSLTAKIKGKFFEYAGSLALPIYCLHWPVYKYVAFYGSGLGYTGGVILTLAVCLVLSVLMKAILSGFKKKACRKA